ncbi:MAG: tRNA (adenosine(37)-N6)-threonylcarbamoyltransferase complex transferase subunit TsaD [Acidobacteria bacterium]|nr:MAG: tRNA (adenosine(37)-N6)-threonylcarbamoyltransferase complex transferase subunit TsaD [Acidobacteriota bacterium]
MLILGIESSCDETAAAVVEEVSDAAKPWMTRSSVVASQVEIHREWGGVVPELASRQHVRDICGVVERALADASLGLRDLDAVAVTQGPGLVGSLLVGLSFAKSLAASIDRPLVPVHHLAGHIESLFLHNGPLPLPAVVLVVSGGHTSLYLVPEPGRYHLIGRTRDDAAGEAYDKVAKLLGLGYPGGPIIDKLAREGNDRAVDFPVTRMTHRDRNAPTLPGRLDFSFSGIKTAVLRYVKDRVVASGQWPVVSGSQASRRPGERQPSQSSPKPGAGSPQPGGGRIFTPSEIADICASFQRSVVETLVDRLFEAAWRHHAKSVGIAGGVSANSRLRRDATARGQELHLPVFLPTLALSTDNAAMIAAAGLRGYHQGIRGGLDLNADPALTLE